jgi:hypothetical protein
VPSVQGDVVNPIAWIIAARVVRLLMNAKASVNNKLFQIEKPGITRLFNLFALAS